MVVYIRYSWKQYGEIVIGEKTLLPIFGRRALWNPGRALNLIDWLPKIN